MATFTGTAGNDTLAGTGAADLLDGRGGTDTIVLENSIFTALTATGPLGAGNFVLGTVALDANDHLIYDSSTGSLWYDVNGSARGGKVLFATLGTTTHPSLAYSDFLVS